MRRYDIIHTLDLSMELSVIIPFKDEYERIGGSIVEIRAFFDSQSIEYELILVDDGSMDDAVTEIITPLLSENNIHLVVHKKNLGKGAAIASGVRVAKGDYIFFTDTDLSTPIAEFTKLYEHRFANIVIGVRTKESLIIKKQPRHRIILGKLGNIAIRALLGLSYRDTQCGFKLFEARLAKQLFSKLIIVRWGFDFDILYQAKKMGIVAREVSVIWRHNGKSKLIPIVDHLRSLYELIYFKIRSSFSKN